MTHVLYSPAHSDFVPERHLAKDKTDPRYGSDKPITTEKPSPTRADAPDRSPAGTHWMGSSMKMIRRLAGPTAPAVKRGTPEMVMRGMHAIRLFPLVRK